MWKGSMLWLLSSNPLVCRLLEYGTIVAGISHRICTKIWSNFIFININILKEYKFNNLGLRTHPLFLLNFFFLFSRDHRLYYKQENKPY